MSFTQQKWQPRTKWLDDPVYGRGRWEQVGYITGTADVTIGAGTLLKGTGATLYFQPVSTPEIENERPPCPSSSEIGTVMRTRVQRARVKEIQKNKALRVELDRVIAASSAVLKARRHDGNTPLDPEKYRLLFRVLRHAIWDYNKAEGILEDGKDG